MSTLLDAQFGFKAESTWGTAVAVTRFGEFMSESLKPNYQVLTGAGFRPGARAVRSDRVARGGMIGLSGSVTWQPLTKGDSNISGLLAAALGSVSSTTTATDSVYTHTGTYGDLAGDSLTVQIGRPDTSGTVQPFTYAGCKVGGLTLKNSLDGILEATLDIAHAKSETTSTSLASASYTSGAELFSWGGGGLTVAGSAVNVTDVSFSLRNSLKIRRYLGGGQAEPLENGIREAMCSFTMEFESLTMLNRIRALTASAGQAKIVGTWNGPTLAGVSAYPQIIATMEIADFTGDYVSTNGQDMIMLTVQAVARYDGTNSPFKIEVKSTDSTP